MTLEEQKAAMDAYFVEKAATYGWSNQLTPAQQTDVTDGAAGVLNTLNPNNDYPPTTKPH
jgi:hypothetical protein